MVGYHKGDNLTGSEKFVAGCVSGCVTRFVTQPMDVLKVKTQLQKDHKKVQSIYALLTNILKQEGVNAFWQGHNLGQIHSVLAISTQFYLYEMTTKFMMNHPKYNKKYKSLTTFLCGASSGCASAALVCPLEVIRVRQMLVKEQYKGILKGASAVYNSGGVLAFYEGLSASLLQMGFQVGIAFCTFSYVQQLILHNLSNKCEDGDCRHAIGNKYHPQDLLVASTVAGSASGLVSKTLTYPFDLFKRRLQIASHNEHSGFTTPATSQGLIKCASLTECFKNTICEEGIKGLYRGYSVTILKSQITSMVAFTSYELTCYAIRELANK